jgi:hypothetical protein
MLEREHTGCRVRVQPGKGETLHFTLDM